MRYMALVVFACFINNKDTGSRDFQALDVKANSPVEVALKVYSIKHDYKNDKGETVSWRLVDVFHVGKITTKCKDMEEISGFIAKKDELFGCYSKVKPKKSYITKMFRDKHQKLDGLTRRRSRNPCLVVSKRVSVKNSRRNRVMA